MHTPSSFTWCDRWGPRHDDDDAAHEVLPGQSTLTKIVGRDTPPPGCNQYEQVIDTNLNGRLDKTPDKVVWEQGRFLNPGAEITIPATVETGRGHRFGQPSPSTRSADHWGLAGEILFLDR